MQAFQTTIGLTEEMKGKFTHTSQFGFGFVFYSYSVSLVVVILDINTKCGQPRSPLPPKKYIVFTTLRSGSLSVFNLMAPRMHCQFSLLVGGVHFTHFKVDASHDAGV